MENLNQIAKLNSNINRHRNLVANEGYSDFDKLIFIKSQDCYLYDSQNNKYIDMSMASGVDLLGHKSEIVLNAIQEQMENGILTTTYNPKTYETMELINKISPFVEKGVFCSSGSEATMRAARIARAYTKKPKIAMFNGAWHGGTEIYMYDYDYTNSNYSNCHRSGGVLNIFKEQVIVLPYNDEIAFDMIEKHKNELAMIIIEPSQGSNPRDDMKYFLEQLKQICIQNKILLCFDEMITGFRVSLGGASEYYNITPDLVTYGKALGGGLPIGFVGGSNEIMNAIKGNENSLAVFMGGTFSANPLVMNVSSKLLKFLIKTKDQTYSFLENLSKNFKNSINRYCTENNIKTQIMGLNSMMRLVFTDYPIKSRKDREKFEIPYINQMEFYNHLLLEKNIFVNKNGILFLSTKHDESVVKYIEKSFQETLLMFKDTINSLQK